MNEKGIFTPIEVYELERLTALCQRLKRRELEIMNGANLALGEYEDILQGINRLGLFKEYRKINEKIVNIERAVHQLKRDPRVRTVISGC